MEVMAMEREKTEEAVEDVRHPQHQATTNMSKEKWGGNVAADRNPNQ